MSTPNSFLVIGSGPCGTLTVGTILKYFPRVAITWVSKTPFSQLGNFGRYMDVPGNTPVSVITKTLRAVPAMNFESAQGNRPSPTLSTWPEDKTCPLGLAIDAYNDASSHLQALPNVETIEATVDDISPCSSSPSSLIASCSSPSSPSPFTVSSSNVFLASGLVPSPPPPTPAHVIPFYTAMSPSSLSSYIKKFSSTCTEFYVTGSSHSGMLAVQNLCKAGVPPSRIKVIHRSPLRYAEAMPGGWTKFDGSGLKGTVAEWCKNDLPPEITFLQTSPDVFASIPSSACVIYSHAWEHESRPSWMGSPLPPHDGYSGTFPRTAAGNLHAVGFAFPEMYTDGEGHEEVSGRAMLERMRAPSSFY
jgi:hypothetical protein